MTDEDQRSCEVTLTVYEGETLPHLRAARDACFYALRDEAPPPEAQDELEFTRAEMNVRQLYREIAEQVPWDTEEI